MSDSSSAQILAYFWSAVELRLRLETVDHGYDDHLEFFTVLSGYSCVCIRKVDSVTVLTY